MSPASEEDEVVSPAEVASKMRIDYVHGFKDQTSKALESLGGILARISAHDFDLMNLYKECASIVSKELGLSSVCIAAWVPSVEQYWFKATVGLGEEAVAVYQKLWYTKNNVVDEKTYPSHEISRQTRLYLSEEHPFAPGQEATFMQPKLIGMRRRSTTDALEADYICTYFFGPKHEVLGWIEYSGTRAGRLPDATTIRWVELVADMLGIATSIKT